MTRAVLLDLEGTTTPLEFVHEVLFPYAHRHAEAWLAEHGRDAADPVAALRAEHRQDSAGAEAPPAWNGDDPVAGAPYLRWLTERDRKSTALKQIQGLIWRDGYESGRIAGQVFDDIQPALVRLRERGIAVAVFSSGSVLAQKLLLGHSSAGDLRPLVDGWYDTTTGPKREAASYRAIAADLGLEPAAVTFVSDVNAELDAAAAAGMRAILSLRGVDTAAEGRPAVSSLLDRVIAG